MRLESWHQCHLLNDEDPPFAREEGLPRWGQATAIARLLGDSEPGREGTLDTSYEAAQHVLATARYVPAALVPPVGLFQNTLPFKCLGSLRNLLGGS